MALLLIWEEVPEDHKLYALDSSSEQAAWARASANLFINSDDIEPDHPIQKLNEWLCPEVGSSQIPLDRARVIKRDFSEVVLCGFIM